jgi:Fe2+ transport system protein FeoA
MHGDGRHCGIRRRRCRDRGADSEQRPLSEGRENTAYVILENSDRQSMEMGLFIGAQVRVIRNNFASPNMVVGVSDSRYMLSKETAQRIIVG